MWNVKRKCIGRNKRNWSMVGIEPTITSICSKREDLPQTYFSRILGKAGLA